MILADRDLVEQGAEEILEGAREKEVTILLLKQVWLTMSYIGGFSCCWGSFWCHHTFGFGVEGQGAGNSTSSMQNVFFMRVSSKTIVKVVHNASIMNAVGCCGLQLYNFGETVGWSWQTFC